MLNLSFYFTFMWQSGKTCHRIQNSDQQPKNNKIRDLIWSLSSSIFDIYIHTYYIFPLKKNWINHFLTLPGIPYTKSQFNQRGGEHSQPVWISFCLRTFLKKWILCSDWVLWSTACQNQFFVFISIACNVSAQSHKLQNRVEHSYTLPRCQRRKDWILSII